MSDFVKSLIVVALVLVSFCAFFYYVGKTVQLIEDEKTFLQRTTIWEERARKCEAK